MLSGRIGIVKALAVLLPVNLLVAFFACASLCLAACDEPEREAAACCRSDAGDSCPEAPPEGTDDDACLLVPADPAVLSDAKPILDEPSVSALPAPVPAAPAAGSIGDVSRRATGPPPRGRPLDRLPVLLI